MGNLLLQGNQYIKSDIDADPDEASEKSGRSNYGQNGYQGPSSDLPGQRTRTGFLPDVTLPEDSKRADWQTRSVPKDAYPTTYGMHKPKDGGTIPQTNSRPVTKRR